MGIQQGKFDEKKPRSIREGEFREEFQEARKECRKRVIGKMGLRMRTRQGELENGSSTKRIGEGKSKENPRRRIGGQSYMPHYENSKMNLGEGNPRRKIPRKRIWRKILENSGKANRRTNNRQGESQ
ncbi:hypothetical protein Zmor_005183 [Zophobas morio]|uniref:Uncharacterized protein n=1 Tax=Zophobas morio TaxID=2755281 RepID=A0AA38IMT6_9CUCU|nr:hypothetical protein Zmor_005183 [Zophobas morio]